MLQDAHANEDCAFLLCGFQEKYMLTQRVIKFFKQLGRTFIEILNHIFKNEIMGNFDEITAQNVTISCCAEIF